MSALDADPALLANLDRAREEIVPFIGERAEALYGWRLARGMGATAWQEHYAALLSGDDAEHPQVTEAERELLLWADGVGAAQGDQDDRMLPGFSPALRSALDRYAVALRALVG